MLRYIVLAISCVLCCTACYRMPEEGEVSVVPTTNNPAMTRKPAGWTPGVAY